MLNSTLKSILNSAMKWFLQAAQMLVSAHAILLSSKNWYCCYCPFYCRLLTTSSPPPCNKCCYIPTSAESTHQLASFEESPQANFFVLCCKYAGMPSCPACSIDSGSSQSVHWHCDGAVPSVLVSLADWWGVKASRNSRSRGRQETSWISSDTHSKQGRSVRLEQKETWWSSCSQSWQLCCMPTYPYSANLNTSLSKAVCCAASFGSWKYRDKTGYTAGLRLNLVHYTSVNLLLGKEHNKISTLVHNTRES